MPTGLDSLRVNLPVPGSISSRRWIVFASVPVVSVSLFAARPVGAHSRHFTFFALRIVKIELTKVVLPTPGPPVITTTRFSRTVFSASRWLGASVLPVLCWHQVTAFSKSIGGEIIGACVRALILAPMPSSAFLRGGREER